MRLLESLFSANETITLMVKRVLSSFSVQAWCCGHTPPGLDDLERDGNASWYAAFTYPQVWMAVGSLRCSYAERISAFLRLGDDPKIIQVYAMCVSKKTAMHRHVHPNKLSPRTWIDIRMSPDISLHMYSCLAPSRRRQSGRRGMQ